MIELKNITFTYSNTKIGSLKNLNLTIKDGECVLITGGSGCGKTTIIRLINGLIPNFFEGELQGEVLINGQNVTQSELYDTAKTVSTVFQNPRSQFFNVDTTSELAFACENHGMPEQEILNRIVKTVAELKLEPLMNRSLFDLSGGQKQKIACASVAVTGNNIILLDEPSANLDLKTIAELRELLKKWKSEGKTIVIAEHRISYLWDIIDRTVILCNGEISKELSRTKMNKLTEDDLHKMGLRTNTVNTVVEPVETTADSKSSITIQNFCYKYKNGHLALNIPYMQIPAGQITAITGNNGEGKTTFLNTLCGLGHRAKGFIEFNEKIYKRHARQKLIFLVMQDVNHQLFTESVLDEVLISQAEENAEEARRILASLDLEAYTDRHPQSLSGGQKQRVAVASANQQAASTTHTCCK